MEFAAKKVVALVLFSAFVCTSAKHLHFNDNIMVEYTADTSKKEIKFNVTAVNITGWVGIGVNEKQGDMNGTDLFVGWRDMYGKPNFKTFLGDGNGLPTKEGHKNWTLVDFTAPNDKNQSFLIASRPFDTSVKDTAVIKDTNMFIVWAYNKDNSVYTAGHTDKNSCAVNFVKDTECLNGGASNLNIGLSTLFLSVVTTIMKM